MKVELAKLKMTHVRDQKVDPLEHEDLGPIRASIKEHGFWGGVVLGKHNGDIEVVAGNKRIVAAMEEGITHIDLPVGRYNESQAIRIYATENITQRGATASLAMAGAVASAVKYLVKGILRGDKDVSQICDTSPKGMETLRGQIASEKGLGVPCIMNFYRGIEGVKESMVKHHLANLKSSGHYARIVQQATDEIEQEHVQELAELKRKQKEAEEKKAADEAEKAKEKAEKVEAAHAEAKATGQEAAAAAAKTEVTFDLAGVGKYFKNDFQLQTFRKVVERKSVRKHLPVDKQAELAKAIVKYSQEKNAELTGEFIEECITALIGEFVSEATKKNKEAMDQMKREDVYVRWRYSSHQFVRRVADVAKESKALIKMKDQYPDLPFSITQELRRAVTYAQPVINELAAKLGL